MPSEPTLYPMRALAHAGLLRRATPAPSTAAVGEGA